MIFHRHKMFIVPLLLLALISRISLTHSYLYGTVKAKSSSTFQSISLFTKILFLLLSHHCRKKLKHFCVCWLLLGLIAGMISSYKFEDFYIEWWRWEWEKKASRVCFLIWRVMNKSRYEEVLLISKTKELPNKIWHHVLCVWNEASL